MKHFIAAFVLMPTALSSAATINMTVTNLDWNEAIWDSPADVPTSGNDYVVNSGLIRMGAGPGDTTFGGDSLTISGAGVSGILKNEGKTSTINGTFTLQDGAQINQGPNTAASATLDVTQFVVLGAGNLVTVGSAGNIFTIDGTLTGSGDFRVDFAPVSGLGGSREVIFTDISNYTGNIIVDEQLGLGFGVTDYTFTGTMTLQNLGSLKLNLGQTLTFTQGNLSDQVNGAVAAGTYSGAALTALGLNYENLGGTLVVIPEPSAALLGVMGLLFLLRRRR